MGGFVSQPSATLNIVGASQLARVDEQKALIVGQMLAGGSATSGELIQDHPDDASEDALFGQRSHLAGMVREFKKINKRSQLDIIPLDDGSGTQGTAVYAITGTATEDGTLIFTVVSSQNHQYEVDVTNGDTAEVIGDALDVLTAADSDAPFTTANVTGTVTATAANDGTLCNEWDIRVSGTVAGVEVAVTGWTGGATDPTLTGILDVIANVRYQTIIWPSVYALTEVQTELDSRFNLTNDVKDGVAIQFLKGTQASLESYVSSINSQSIVVIGNKTVSETLRKGTAIPEMPDILAAKFAAIRALRLTDGANLTSILTTVASQDQYGGISIASLPYHNTLILEVGIPQPDDFFTQVEQNSLEDNGIAVIGPNRTYSNIVCGEIVTTYLADAASNPDDSYKYLNYVDTASEARNYYFNNLKSRYAQTRLTDGGLIAGRDMANVSSIRAFCNELWEELADAGLFQAGRAAKKDFNLNLIITATISTGTVSIDMAPLLVSQLRVIVGTIQINFGT